MRPEVQEILQKRDTLIELKERITSAIQEVQVHSIQVIPRFEEYGWSRLDAFAKRLRDALDDPLVEQARQTLEKAGFLLDYQTIKDAVQEKHQDTLELLRKIMANLADVKGDEIYQKVVNDIESFLKRGRWDEALDRSQEWKGFHVDYTKIRKEMTSTIRTLALKEMLEQGPGSVVPEQFSAMKEQAIALGGTGLWTIISKESHKTLNEAKASLEKLSLLKTELEQVKGESFNLSSLLKRQISITAVGETLQEEIQKSRRQLSQELNEIELLLRRVNNVSLLAEEDQEEAKLVGSLKEAHEHNAYLGKRLEQLRLKVRQSLSEDAIGLAESLTQKQLPEDWTDARTVAALRQLLEKYAFRLEV